MPPTVDGLAVERRDAVRVVVVAGCCPAQRTAGADEVGGATHGLLPDSSLAAVTSEWIVNARAAVARSPAPFGKSRPSESST